MERKSFPDFHEKNVLSVVGIGRLCKSNHNKSGITGLDNFIGKSNLITGKISSPKLVSC